MKEPSASGNVINTIINGQTVDALKICSTCKSALYKNNIPHLSVSNGFHYAITPQQLPKIDLMAERLISPLISFIQIRRIRDVQGQFGIYGQIINVPVAVYTMFHICQASRDGSFFFSYDSRAMLFLKNVNNTFLNKITCLFLPFSYDWELYTVMSVLNPL